MKPPSLPRRELVAFIRERSGKVGTREIARAFGAKNADRAALNRMLRELADEGQVDRRRKRLHHAGTLPPVVLADITGRDSDGELLARPTEWDEEAHGAPPVIHIVTPRRARPGEAAGVGDRALIRIERTSDEETTGRVIKLIDRAKHRVLGIFRGLPDGGGRLVPIDKKQLGRELTIPPSATAGAVDGDLVAVEVARHGRLGLADRHGRRAARLAQERARRQPDRHPRPRHSARISARGARGSRSRAAGDARRTAKIGATCPSSPSIRPTPRITTTRSMRCPIPIRSNPGGYIVSVAIADVAHYVRPGSALDREALRRGNSVYFPDRVVPMLPERISNDLCSLRPHEDRPALAVRMVIGADGRKRSHTFHRVLIRSAARLHYEQAQLAVSGRTDEITEPIVEKILEPLYAAYRTVLPRPRRTRPARSRHSRTQDRAQIRRHRRSRDHAAAAGSAPADRGIHDPRQRRRRRNLRARATCR